MLSHELRNTAHTTLCREEPDRSETAAWVASASGSTPEPTGTECAATPSSRHRQRSPVHSHASTTTNLTLRHDHRSGAFLSVALSLLFLQLNRKSRMGTGSFGFAFASGFACLPEEGLLLSFESFFGIAISDNKHELSLYKQRRVEDHRGLLCSSPLLVPISLLLVRVQPTTVVNDSLVKGVAVPEVPLEQTHAILR